MLDRTGAAGEFIQSLETFADENESLASLSEALAKLHWLHCTPEDPEAVVVHLSGLSTRITDGCLTSVPWVAIRRGEQLAYLIGALQYDDLRGTWELHT